MHKIWKIWISFTKFWKFFSKTILLCSYSIYLSRKDPRTNQIKQLMTKPLLNVTSSPKWPRGTEIVKIWNPPLSTRAVDIDFCDIWSIFQKKNSWSKVKWENLWNIFFLIFNFFSSVFTAHWAIKNKEMAAFTKQIPYG